MMHGTFNVKLATNYFDKVKFFLNSDCVIISLKGKGMFCCSLPTSPRSGSATPLKLSYMHFSFREGLRMLTYLQEQKLYTTDCGITASGHIRRRLARKYSPVDPKCEALLVEAISDGTRALSGTEALVDGSCCLHCCAVDAPVEEEHHEHWQVERPQRRIYNVASVVRQFAGQLAGSQNLKEGGLLLSS